MQTRTTTLTLFRTAPSPVATPQPRRQSLSKGATSVCGGGEGGVALAVLRTAPSPVVTPQPSRQTLSRGASLVILATLTSCTTVYSVKVDVPICMQCRVSERGGGVPWHWL